MLDDTVLTVFPLDKDYYLWLTAKGESGVIYYIVSDNLRREYYLYKEKKKMAKKSENPQDLYKYIK